MGFKSRRWLTVALAGAMLSLAACSGGDSDDSGGGTIAFSQPFTNSPTRTAIVGFSADRAEELGYELLLDEANADGARQAAAIETWIVSEVDAIAVFTVPGGDTTALAAEALDKGIHWGQLRGVRRPADLVGDIPERRRRPQTGRGRSRMDQRAGLGQSRDPDLRPVAAGGRAVRPLQVDPGRDGAGRGDRRRAGRRCVHRGRG